MKPIIKTTPSRTKKNRIPARPSAGGNGIHQGKKSAALTGGVRAFGLDKIKNYLLRLSPQAAYFATRSSRSAGSLPMVST